MFEASQTRSCNDKNLKSCPKWASNGYCTRSRRFMKRNCKKSCNKCPGKIYHNNCDMPLIAQFGHTYHGECMWAKVFQFRYLMTPQQQNVNTFVVI